MISYLPIPARKFPTVFCLAALLFLSACASAPIPNSGAGAPRATATMDMPLVSTASQAAASSTPMPIAGPHVAISNFTFSPATLTVPVGATVTWVNQDDIPHTVTSVDKRFGSQALDTGDRYSFRFTAPGTYAYFCTIHPKMVGVIIVK